MIAKHFPFSNPELEQEFVVRGTEQANKLFSDFLLMVKHGNHSKNEVYIELLTTKFFGEAYNARLKTLFEENSYTVREEEYNGTLHMVISW